MYFVPGRKKNEKKKNKRTKPPWKKLPILAWGKDCAPRSPDKGVCLPLGSGYLEMCPSPGPAGCLQ